MYAGYPAVLLSNRARGIVVLLLLQPHVSAFAERPGGKVGRAGSNKKSKDVREIKA